VLVILMRGQKHVVQGPMAAGIAGRIYRQLRDENYFARNHTETGVSTFASVTSQKQSSAAFTTPALMMDETTNTDIPANNFIH
jgi:hypothetical protein